VTGQKALRRHQGPHGQLGRDRNNLKILPGAFVVVGDSVEQAKENARCSTAGALRQAIASISVQLGH